MPPRLPRELHKGKDGLTPMQRRFVEAYVSTGGRLVQSALLAGVKDTNATSNGSRWLRSPHVLAAIKAETDRAIRADVAVARQVLHDLVVDPNTPPAVRLKGAETLLDRGGLLVTREVQHHHAVEVNDSRSVSELKDSIAQLQRELGLTPGAPIDAEYTEVTALPAAQRQPNGD